jgi:pyruvate,water dikinase
MYLTATPDFASIQWGDPADAERDWWLDRTHCPVALPPLPAALFGEWIAAGLNARLITVNGYVFMADDAEPRAADFGVPAVQVWDERAPGVVQAPCLAIRLRQYDESDVRAAHEALEAALAESAAAFTFTMEVAGALFPLAGRLVGFCTSVVGPSGPLEAATIVGDGNNVTLESAAGLEQLAEMARADPSVASLVRSGDVGALRSAPQAAAFSRAFDAYLERFGWRCQEWTDLHRPPWADEPHIPLAIVARYLDSPEQRPSASFGRARAARAEAIARIEAAIGESARVQEFRGLLASLEGAQRVIEERSHWQMLLFAALRQPVLALGRALVRAGFIRQPDDVHFLSLAELRELAYGGSAADAVAVVATRRGQLAEWERLHAPISIGKSGVRQTPPPEWGSASDEGHGGPVGQRVLKGVGVSRGVVSGRARTAGSLEAAEKAIEPGDILVCRSTSPPWTPLFAVAGGIVTDAGGMLSHAAITAREYGIPAVTNTGRATLEIPDGARVTVDGAAGTVIIHD